MSHETLRDQLLDLAYGELPRRAARKLERHVAGCPECRAELDRIRGTRAMMSGLGQVQAPEAGESILLAAAREAARSRQRPAPILPSWMWSGALTAVVIAGAVALSYRALQDQPGRPGRTDTGALVGPSFQRAPAPVAHSAPPADAAGAASEAPAAPPAAAPAREAKREALAEAEAPRKALGVPRPAPEATRASEEASAGQRARAPAQSDAPVAHLEPSEPAGRGAQAERDVSTAHPERSEPSGRAESKGAPAVASAAPPAEEAEAKSFALGESEDVAPRPSPSSGRVDTRSADKSVPRAAAPATAEALQRRSVGTAASFSAPPPAGEEDAIARHARLQAAGRLNLATRTFPGCEGEQFRQVERERGGQTVKLTRRGSVAGAPFEVELYYAEGGALAAARYREGSGPVHEVRLTGTADGGLVPPAMLAPRTASEVTIDAPPHCER